MAEVRGQGRDGGQNSLENSLKNELNLVTIEALGHQKG